MKRYLGWLTLRPRPSPRSAVSPLSRVYAVGSDVSLLFLVSTLEASVRQAGSHKIMNTITVVELKRYGWSQKIIRKSYAIVGRPPYAKGLKLHEVWRKVMPRPNKKGRRRRNAENICLFPASPDAVWFLPKRA